MTVGCPLHNLIPEWNDEVYRGHPGHALSRLLKNNNFPEFTGRVCPALCEKACINGLDGEPVTVHDNELYIIEHAFRDGKLTELEGTEEEHPCGLLLIAAGFTGCERYTPDAFGVSLDPRGRVKTEAGSYATEIPGVFTAGDMHRGQSLVVWAIHEGRGCAREIDRFLMGYTEMAE